MKIIIAPDSFKGSLSASDCTRIASESAYRVLGATTDVHCLPIADGGEGTVDALVTATHGERRSVSVSGPLGETVPVEWGVLFGDTAILETASCAGLPLVPTHLRNPKATTSFGLGELIEHVLDQGLSTLNIGLGGSATNDGGMGMLKALGVQFYDAHGALLQGCGADLARVERIDVSKLDARIGKAHIQAICDVKNPLLGKNGATHIYAPQKGANEQTVSELEQGMTHFSQIAAQTIGSPYGGVPGAGAAGGIGAALLGFLHAELKPGIDVVLDAVHFDSLIHDADLVITGEGRLDFQSLKYGKVPAGILSRCQKYDVPVVIVTGSDGIGDDNSVEYSNMLLNAVVMPLPNRPMSLEESMNNAPLLMKLTCDRIFKMLRLGLNMRR